MRKFLVTLVLQIPFGPSASHADVLFIDLNDGFAEQQAARSAAERRGEKLIVIPSFDPATQAHIHSLELQISALENQVHSKNLPKESPKRAEAAKKEDTLQMELDGLKKKYVSPEIVDESLKGLERSGSKLTSLVISGHDGNGSFMGFNGGFTTQSLNSVFGQHPSLSSNVRSIFLAGCYTAAPGEMEHTWKEAFPNLQDLAGYQKTAPLAEATAGHDYLRNFLEHDRELAGADSDAKIHQLTSALVPAITGDLAAICLPNKKFATRQGVGTLEAFWKKCEALADRVKKEGQVFRDFNEANAGFENPPEDPHKGPLRAYYDDTQEVEPCTYAPDFDAKKLDLPHPDGVLRLIFYRGVMKNLKALHGKDLSEYVKILEDAGVPTAEAEQITNFDALSRKDALKLVGSINNRLKTDSQQLEGMNDKRAASLLAAEKVGAFLQKLVVQLDHNCIPDTWIDNVSRSASSCAPGDAKTIVSGTAAKLPELRIDAQIEHLEQLRGNAKRFHRDTEKEPAPSPTGVASGITAYNNNVLDSKINALMNKNQILMLERTNVNPQGLVMARARQNDLDARAALAGERVDQALLDAKPIEYLTAALKGSQVDVAKTLEAIDATKFALQREGALETDLTKIDKAQLDLEQRDLGLYRQRTEFIQGLLKNAQDSKLDDAAAIADTGATVGRRFIEQRTMDYDRMHANEVSLSRQKAECARIQCADAGKIDQIHEATVDAIVDDETRP